MGFSVPSPEKQNLPSLFISRELSATSSFYQLFPHWRLAACSLVMLQARAFPPPPPHQWVFFYSAHAFSFYLQGLPSAAAHYLEGVGLAALGPGTAAAMTRAGWPPHFVGTGEPGHTATAFGALAAGQRVLFPRAAGSRRSVERALGAAIQSLDLVVYDNQPNPEAAAALPYCDYLVFTSPLNVQAYYAQHPVAPAQRVVAIGAATGQALAVAGVNNLKIAPQPAEAALAATVLAWSANVV